ncbi:MAG: type II toxin-antitoxin system RelE/ParE family toxin [Prevotellaceae bacterium]|jgi:hypothetical protein|nr:type II toxin-antitoxin system RelE/ParE family toxin [Prevotellaceae bacterium]
MNCDVIATVTFRKDAKALSKKYRSLKNDLDALEQELRENPYQGVDLGNNTRKIRIAIASKNKGKSGGARVITCNLVVNIEETKVYLLTIYDKSEQDNISEKRIAELKQENGLANL